MNMKTPGIPKAIRGPDRSSNSGIRIVENAEPKLMEK